MCQPMLKNINLAAMTVSITLAYMTSPTCSQAQDTREMSTAAQTDAPDERSQFDFDTFYMLPNRSFTNKLQHKDQSVIRREAVFIIRRLFGYESRTIYPETKRDALLAALAPMTFTTGVKVDGMLRDVGDWGSYKYYSAIQSGVFKPRSSEYFGSSEALTRGSVAVLVCRLLQRQPKQVSLNIDGANFRDVSGREWWYGAALVATGAHLMEGFPDHTFRGERPVTRAELVMVMNRLQKIIPREVR